MMKKIIFYPTAILVLLILITIMGYAQENDEIGINSLEEIELGGVKQWILIRGHSTSNPILLYLHGGPGFPQMPFTHIDSRKLEKHFLVVNWDQRGSGKSRSPDIPAESMNIEQFLSDTHELIKMLRSRFSQEKIFLLGHSWGSILGLYTASKYPEYLHAYIGMGQVVSVKEGEIVSYKYTLEEAEKAKNVKDVELLKGIGSPMNWESFQSVSMQRRLLAKYGGSFRNITYIDMGRFWNMSSYYSDEDKSNILLTFANTLNMMWKKLMKVDFFKEITEVSVPVYFFTGRYDYQTPFEIVERYFGILKAPYKEIVWFEDSGHVPNLDEPEVYQDKLINFVLKNTISGEEK